MGRKSKDILFPEWFSFFLQTLHLPSLPPSPSGMNYLAVLFRVTPLSLYLCLYLYKPLSPSSTVHILSFFRACFQPLIFSWQADSNMQEADNLSMTNQAKNGKIWHCNTIKIRLNQRFEMKLQTHLLSALIILCAGRGKSCFTQREINWRNYGLKSSCPLKSFITNLRTFMSEPCLQVYKLTVSDGFKCSVFP